MTAAFVIPVTAAPGAPEAQRRKRTLPWNREDVLRVLESQLGTGAGYKSLDFPVSYYSFHQFDAVHDAAGNQAGVSCHNGYLSGRGEVLSLAMLDAHHCEVGTELLLTWGEPAGGSRKPQVERHEQTEVRVTVAPAPRSGAVQRLRRSPVGTSASA